MGPSAHIVFSDKAMDRLMALGLTTGWLAGWLRSAGANDVSLHWLHSDDWQALPGWMMVIADEAELGRVALAHGRRLVLGNNGQRHIKGAEAVIMDNPWRCGWFYRRHAERWATLLMPPGDMIYQRQRWLSLFAGKHGCRPLSVCLGEEGNVLEPGLCTDSATQVKILNQAGLLPEEQVIRKLRQAGLYLRTAESCTAGAIAARMARVPGASDVLAGGMVVYANELKQQWLQVPSALLEQHGAVSQVVVEAMAQGGCSGDSVCVAVSGIAGPAGGNAQKPVGTVWLAVALPGYSPLSRCCHFQGGRSDVQSATVVYALAMVLEYLDDVLSLPIAE